MTSQVLRLLVNHLLWSSHVSCHDWWQWHLWRDKTFCRNFTNFDIYWPKFFSIWLSWLVAHDRRYLLLKVLFRPTKTSTGFYAGFRSRQVGISTFDFYEYESFFSTWIGQSGVKITILDELIDTLELVSGVKYFCSNPCS